VGLIGGVGGLTIVISRLVCTIAEGNNIFFIRRSGSVVCHC
jgi:hypothetical protein